jgi:hypothetical protein
MCGLAAIIASPHNPGVAATETNQTSIAYVRASTRDEIRLVEPDGTGNRLLWSHGKRDPQNVYEIDSLTWRSDGTDLAFSGTHENACSLNNRDIFSIRADGSGYRRITEAPACAALAGYPQGTVQVPVRNSGFDSFVGFVYFQGAPVAQQVSPAPGGSTLLTFNNVADFGADMLQIATMIQGSNREISVGTAVDVVAGGTVRSEQMSVFNLSMFSVWETHSPTWRLDGSRIGYVLNYNSVRKLAPAPPPLDFGEDLLATSSSEMPDFSHAFDLGAGACYGKPIAVCGKPGIRL